MKPLLKFGTFGRNDANGGRPMPAMINGIEIGRISRVVADGRRSFAVSQANKIVVVGYEAEPLTQGLRAFGADQATIDRIWDAIDDSKTHKTLAEAKDALRAALAKA